MENFSGIGPEVTNRKTIREPRKHRPRRNQRGTKKMATAAESRKKSRPPARAARQELLRRKDGATTAEGSLRAAIPRRAGQVAGLHSGRLPAALAWRRQRTV